MGNRWKDVTIQIDESTDPIAIKVVDKAIGIIRSKKAISYRDAIKEALIDGLKNNEHVKDDPQVDRWMTQREFLESAAQEAREQIRYAKAYKTLGPERFMEKANEMGLDLAEIEKFLDYHQVPITSWYDKAKRWLSSMLFVCGGSMDVGTIKLRAIESGLLTSPDVDRERHDREWSSIKTCAGELGMTSRKHKGYWKAIANGEQLPLQ